MLKKDKVAVIPSDEKLKKAIKRLEKRKSNRKCRYTLAAFLATGGMPWLV